MEDLPIGSEITLKVIETEGCNDCFFGGQICEHIKCCKDERKILTEYPLIDDNDL